ncbi:unnamed protein product [Phytophthora fragariaefolia]|uniref:Unnamed protein product n=1 Tax=Phytophthora fragariaefolia TaxID=1490495 RepID=A0A9W6YBE5_9STRA|nr:unnamed protein product [Phytophthora fragariaefolia]
MLIARKPAALNSISSSLTDGAREAINADAQTGVSVSQSLARIVAVNPGISLQPQDLYNVRNKGFNFRLEGKTRMRFLLDTLDSELFVVSHQVDAHNRISHLFFAAQESINIYKNNPDVLLLDCTYKTNKFKMPLLDIVGVSGMNMTIHVAQSYLKGEDKDDYLFALKALGKMMTDQHIALPQLILVDRDLALLNALEEIFPEVPALLCIWHKDSQDHRQFCEAFNKVIRSRTEDEYNAACENLRKLSPTEAAYVDNIWLDIWKWRLVHYWTNQITHFGLQATSRVEGYHSALKRCLRSSRGDMLTAFTRMQHWWAQTNRKYWDRVANTKIKALASLQKPIFHGVTTVIHNHAQKKCLEQIDLITSKPCSGLFTRTTGIPCSHKLAIVSARTPR